jgi:hypothetical protein
MLLGADDLGDREIFQSRARILDAFNLKSDAGQLVGNGLNIRVGLSAMTK